MIESEQERLGRERKEIAEGRKYLHHVERLCIDLVMGLAALGQGKEALRVLQGAPSAFMMEPLVIALRIMNGEKDVRTAYEINEVANDVIANILELREKKGGEG